MKFNVKSFVDIFSFALEAYYIPAFDTVHMK